MADTRMYPVYLRKEPFMPLVSQGHNDGLAPLVNIGVGHDLPIREIQETVAAAVGSASRLEFDVTKPDGTPHRLMSVDRLTAMGWTAMTGMREGLADAYADFLAKSA